MQGFVWKFLCPILCKFLFIYSFTPIEWVKLKTIRLKKKKKNLFDFCNSRTLVWTVEASKVCSSPCSVWLAVVVLFCIVWLAVVLFCIVWLVVVLSCSVLYGWLLCCPVLYCMAVCCVVLYYNCMAVLCCPGLYWMAVCWPVLFYTVWPVPLCSVWTCTIM